MQMKIVLLVLVLLLGGFVMPAFAQQCNNGSLDVTLGTGSRTSNIDGISTLSYTCQANANPTYYTLCLFIGEGTAPATGLAPRRLTDYNNHFLDYNLYSNAARTNIIGPPPTGGSYAVYTWNVLVPGSWQQITPTLPIYTRLSAIPSATPAANYQAQLSNNKIQYSWSNTGYPSSCLTGNSGISTLYIGVTASAPSGCTMDITSVSTLDFGTVQTLNSDVTSSSAIELNCPSNTQWQLGLSNGLNNTGATRRMKKDNAYITYDLYKDSSRTQRWGNTLNADTYTGTGGNGVISVPVYGKVPAQATPPAGAYSDIITVTLTY